MRSATARVVTSVLALLGIVTPGLSAASSRFGEVVNVTGASLTTVQGCPLDRLTVMACTGASCRPIPFQVDQHDAADNWILDHGPGANADQASGILGPGDALLFMAADAGDRVQSIGPPGSPAVEISVRDPLSDSTHWAYLVAFPDRAPRSELSYVTYDAAHDRARGRRISLGFFQGMPAYLAIAGAGAGEERNLLDRLKVRATATFLWGLIRFKRDESDLRTQFVGWRQGPIRIIRRQKQWVRIGWGIRSPAFGSYTYFYPDFAELPVSLKLNFPPRYFFGKITVRAIVDFRELSDWSLLAPSLPRPIAINTGKSELNSAMNDVADTWFALLGPELSLLQTLGRSPSLTTVRQRLLYNDSPRPNPPESVAGERPGVGFVLDRWDRVGAGWHQLQSTSYALPPALDVRAFMAARAVPLEVSVRPLGNQS